MHNGFYFWIEPLTDVARQHSLSYQFLDVRNLISYTTNPPLAQIIPKS